MLEITLMKSLYHEMNPDLISEAKETTNDEALASRFRILPLYLPEYPKLHSFAAEVRYLAYGGATYHLHFNDRLSEDVDIHSEEAKAVLLYFFRTYKPDYFKADLPEDLNDTDILDCFDAGLIPDYRPKYAFPGIVMFEDIKNGKVKAADGSVPSFPGLRMLNKKEDKEEKPAFLSECDNYTEFSGDNDKFQEKLEALKKQFK